MAIEKLEGGVRRAENRENPRSKKKILVDFSTHPGGVKFLHEADGEPVKTEKKGLQWGLFSRRKRNFPVKSARLTEATEGSEDYSGVGKF